MQIIVIEWIRIAINTKSSIWFGNDLRLLLHTESTPERINLNRLSTFSYLNKNYEIRNYRTM